MVEVNVILGVPAWIHLLWMRSKVVEVNVVIIGAGMHSLVSCFAVNNSNLAIVEVFMRML